VESQSLSDDRKAKYMDWDDVMICQAKAKQMYEAGLMNLADYLLICLYTLQPPVRADYSEMRIVKSLNSTKKENNYAEVCGDIVFFEFRVYKTCKTYGVVSLKANSTVSELIKKKKAESFSKICYVSSLSRTKMSERLSEIFVKCGGKPITITLLRHSYITAFYKENPNPSITVKKDLAKKMLHSRFVQEVYNVLDIPDEESEDTIEDEGDYKPYQDDLVIEPTGWSVDSSVHKRVLEEVLELKQELIKKDEEYEKLQDKYLALQDKHLDYLEKDSQFMKSILNQSSDA
jgi:hypothetical protein